MLRESAIPKSSKAVVRQRFVRQLYTFKLALPSEAELLPHILGAMLDAMDGPQHRIMRTNRNASRSQLCEWALEYVPEKMLLRTIWMDDKISKRARAAALVLYLLHPAADDTVELRIFFNLYEDSDASWLLPGIGYALFDRIARRERIALETFGVLLQRSANNFFGRSALDPVLQAWREMPGSPVTKFGQRELWR